MRFIERRNNGFTLIELAIASSLAAIIALCVYATLAQGIKIWQRASAQVYEEDLNIFLDRIGYELRNAVKFKNMQFSGTKSEIKFSTLVMSNSKQPGLERNIGEVEYSFIKEREFLVRRQRDFSQIYSEKQALDTVALGLVKNASFQYYFYDRKKSEYLWQEEWAEDGLPEAVRIELDFEDGLNLSHLASTVTIPVSGWIK